jgi:hypothetical protein
LFSGLNAKMFTDGQPYLTIPYTVTVGVSKIYFGLDALNYP